MTPQSLRCHACGAEEIESLGPAGLRPGSVRSDSLPCGLPAVVWRCSSCGHLQKHPTPNERAEIERIYATYQAHHLSGGREQLVFPEGKQPRPRTLHCLEQCLPMLPESGSLLDVGTGRGAVLESASTLLPEWSLYAFDVGDRYRTQIESMRGVAGFWSGDFDAVPNAAFDLAVLWQTLEHIPDPSSFLLEILDKLAPGGRVLIQVPDVLRNPFDLAVIDHESHFGPEQLMRVCGRAGLRAALDGNAWVHNCVTVLLEQGGSRPATKRAGETEWVFPWLEYALTTMSAEIGDEPFAIFGTGMAGLWMAGQFARPPEFFVDEDEVRAGQIVAESEIVAPPEVDGSIPIVMSLVGDTAEVIAKRLAARYPGLSSTRFITAPTPGFADAALGVGTVRH